MRGKALMVLLFVLVGLSAQAAEPPAFRSQHLADHPLVGRIWSVADGHLVEPEQLVDAAVAADFVLLGEIHTNPDHHTLQAWLIGELVAAGRRPAVVFEMISRDVQDRIDAHLRAAPQDAAGFGDAVGWSQTGWPDWTLYQPILEAALPAGLSVHAGDPVPDERRNVGREGLAVLAPEERSRLGLDVVPNEADTQAMQRALSEGHCGLVPPDALGPMEAVQRFRDATLADSLIAAAKAAPAEGGGAVLIAGSGHVRADTAVPVYLARRMPSARILAVAFVEVDPDRPDPSHYLPQAVGGAAPYAFLWFTPRVSVNDSCDGLRERFRKRNG